MKFITPNSKGYQTVGGASHLLIIFDFNRINRVFPISIYFPYDTAVFPSFAKSLLSAIIIKRDLLRNSFSFLRSS